MIASIDLTTSVPISFVCESACSASVRTARSTASFASSVFGLNSFLRRESNSVTSTAPVSAWGSCWDLGSAMALLRSRAHATQLFLVLRILGRRQRLQERRVLQELGNQVLRPGLPVHVGNQVRELLPGFEQLVERVDL